MRHSKKLVKSIGVYELFGISDRAFHAKSAVAVHSVGIAYFAVPFGAHTQESLKLLSIHKGVVLFEYSPFHKQSGGP